MSELACWVTSTLDNPRAERRLRNDGCMRRREGQVDMEL